MEIYGKKIILTLVYCPPKQEISTFIDGMTSIFRDTWKGVWIMLLSNYNLDQVLQGNINRLVCLKEIFRLQQCSRHSIRQLGGILNLESANLFIFLFCPGLGCLLFLFIMLLCSLPSYTALILCVFVFVAQP